MECRECPYGKEDFEIRMYHYEKIVQEQGIPNDVFGYWTYEDAVENTERFHWCDKVGGKVYCFGYCTDAYPEVRRPEICSKKKRKNKRERDIVHKNHLKHLYRHHHYSSPVCYSDEIYVKGQGYIENPRPYYKRIYRGRRSKYFKKQSSKRIRRYKGELHNGWHCHRIYDFWNNYC